MCCAKAKRRFRCSNTEFALRGVKVVTLAPNIPGPVAAARLRDLGATVLKVEAPAGDFLATAAPLWYARLHDRLTVLTLDLKTGDGREALAAQLANADVLLTSSRPSALARLGLAWPELHERHPRLCHVAIVGELPPHAERPGHDLTYCADAGLLDPPAMPRTVVADLAGAERAVAATLAALLQRERTNEATQTYVALADAANDFAAPLEAGLTQNGGALGGGFAGYRCYRASDGWIALAALEPHFFKRVLDLLAFDDAAGLEGAFARRDVAAWEAWAHANDIPLHAVPAHSRVLGVA